MAAARKIPEPTQVVVAEAEPRDSLDTGQGTELGGAAAAAGEIMIAERLQTVIKGIGDLLKKTQAELDKVWKAGAKTVAEGQTKRKAEKESEKGAGPKQGAALEGAAQAAKAGVEAPSDPETGGIEDNGGILKRIEEGLNLWNGMRKKDPDTGASTACMRCCRSSPPGKPEELEKKLKTLKEQMEKGTDPFRPQAPETNAPPASCPNVFDWALALPDSWAEFKEPERKKQGWEGGVGDFYSEDIVQPYEERKDNPDGACRPRTKGGATCLFDNWRRVAERVIGALQGKATNPRHEVPEDTKLQLALIGKDDAAEGIAVIFAYSYETKAPDGTSRPTQIYSTATRCMREMGDPDWRGRLGPEVQKRHKKVIEKFHPFLWRLDRILLQLPHEAKHVFRGIDCRVADDYVMSTLVPWAAHTSTSVSSEVSWGFMKESAGTFFIVLAETVAGISFFSWLPDEDEWLMHTHCVLQVASKLDPSLQQMLNTNHDIVVLFQVDNRGGQVVSAEKRVDNALMSARESALVFGPFIETFVQPNVVTEYKGWFKSAEPVQAEKAKQSADAADRAAEDSEQQGTKLLDTFNRFMLSKAQVAVLQGAGGTGKTSAGLRLVHHALSVRVNPRSMSINVPVTSPKVSSPANAPKPPGHDSAGAEAASPANGSKVPDGDAAGDETSSHVKSDKPAAPSTPMSPGRTDSASQMLPVFVSLPAVPKLLTNVPHAGWRPLVDHILRSLSLSLKKEDGDLKELRKRRLLLVLDSVEEAVGKHSLLRKHTLLAIGGIELTEWEHVKIIITVRGEHLEQEKLTAENLGGNCLESWTLQPFTGALIRTFADKIANLSCRKLARRIQPQAVGDAKVDHFLKKMLCPPPAKEKALKLQAAVRRLVKEDGKTVTKAAEEALQTDAGKECLLEMRANITHNVEAIPKEQIVATSEKPKGQKEEYEERPLLETAFIATMVVAAGQLLDADALKEDARREIYNTWCRNSIRRRLDRVAGKLADARVKVQRPDEDWIAWARRLSWGLVRGTVQVKPTEREWRFKDLKEEVQIDVVMRFCMDLAVSEVMLVVAEGLKSYSTLHRMVRVGDVVKYKLGELHPSYNRILLEAAPLRLQSTKNDDALLSFRHATVHDHFAAERIRLHFEDQEVVHQGGACPPMVQDRVEEARSISQRLAIFNLDKHPAFNKRLKEAAAAHSGAKETLDGWRKNGIRGKALLRICFLALFCAVITISVWATRWGDLWLGLMYVSMVLPFVPEFITAVCTEYDAATQRLLQSYWWGIGTIIFATCCGLRIYDDCHRFADENVEIWDGLAGSCYEHHLLFTCALGIPWMLLFFTRTIRYFIAGILNARIFRFQNWGEFFGCFFLVGLQAAGFLSFLVLDSILWETPWWMTYSGGTEYERHWMIFWDGLLFALWAKALYGMVVHVPRPIGSVPADEKPVDEKPAAAAESAAAGPPSAPACCLLAAAVLTVAAGEPRPHAFVAAVVSSSPRSAAPHRPGLTALQAAAAPQ